MLIGIGGMRQGDCVGSFDYASSDVQRMAILGEFVLYLTEPVFLAHLSVVLSTHAVSFPLLVVLRKQFFL